jgi:hypothetical protein
MAAFVGLPRKSVDFGVAGETPKKYQTFFRDEAPQQVGLDYRASLPKKKSVSGFEVPGATPKKTQTYFKFDAPEQVSIDKARSERPPKKSVSLGVEGATPKKVQLYEKQGAPSDLDRGSPDRVDAAPSVLKGVSAYTDSSESDAKSNPLASPPASILQRPKTSRGKAHPSPDEFVSYVISPETSPERIYEQTQSMSVHADGDMTPIPINFDSTFVPEAFPTSSYDNIDRTNNKSELEALAMALFGVALLV